MGPVELMLLSAVILVGSVIVCGSNMAHMSRSSNMGGIGIIVHMVSALAASFAGLGIVGGFIWFLVDRYAG